MKKTLAIDSTVGGLGDVWMRLAALYSLAALQPNVEMTLRIPASLLEVAKVACPDRLRITDQRLPGAIRFSHLGLRDLWRPMCQGEKFITPFFQIQRADRKQTRLKNHINNFLIQSVGKTRALYVPTTQTVNEYQGLHEFSSLPEFSEIDKADFQSQAARDFLLTRHRLQSAWPLAARPTWKILVFPSGTGHQIMPPEWAKQYLPDATYAFFRKDDFQDAFKQLSLKTALFDSTRQLLEMAAKAHRIIVTDSFPSHPTQIFTSATIVALSQQPRSRIVHPGFDGNVVVSRAGCCPCANRARGFGACDAGHDYCVTWLDNTYSRTLIEAVA